MKTLREIIEWALSMDGDDPPATAEQLAREVERRVAREDAERSDAQLYSVTDAGRAVLAHA